MKKEPKNQPKNNNDEKFTIILREIIRIEKEMEVGFGNLRNNFNQLQEAVDGFAKKADTYFQEMLMLSHKVDRLEKWIFEIAEKTGVRLRH